MNRENDYGLHKYLPPKWPIYKQILDFLEWSDLKRGLSEKTVTLRRSSIRLFLVHSRLYDLQEITTDMIDDWIGSLREGGIHL